MGRTIYHQDLTTYSESSIYDKILAFLQNGEAIPPQELDSEGAFSRSIDSTNIGWRFSGYGNEIQTEDILETSTFGNGAAWGIQWLDENSQGKFPQYYEIRNGLPIPISENEIPSETQLKDLVLPPKTASEYDSYYNPPPAASFSLDTNTDNPYHANNPSFIFNVLPATGTDAVTDFIEEFSSVSCSSTSNAGVDLSDSLLIESFGFGNAVFSKVDPVTREPLGSPGITGSYSDVRVPSEYRKHWHDGTISISGDCYLWTTAAGVSWKVGLNPVLKSTGWPEPEGGRVYTSDLIDGSSISYGWYKFVEQPAIRKLNLSEAKKAQLQSVVEAIHTTDWGPSNPVMKEPTFGDLVEIDSGLLVTAPAGLEIGYVPVAINQFLTPK